MTEQTNWQVGCRSRTDHAVEPIISPPQWQLSVRATVGPLGIDGELGPFPEVGLCRQTAGLSDNSWTTDVSLTIYPVVLLAALLHAAWNAMVKGGNDKELSMAAVVIGQVPFAATMLLFIPSPDPASLPWLICRFIFHVGYQLLLVKSYPTGELAQVYPLVRGSAPLIVAAVSVFVLGIPLSQMELCAIGVIGLGIASLGLVRRHEGHLNTPPDPNSYHTADHFKMGG